MTDLELFWAVLRHCCENRGEIHRVSLFGKASFNALVIYDGKTMTISYTNPNDEPDTTWHGLNYDYDLERLVSETRRAVGKT